MPFLLLRIQKWLLLCSVTWNTNHDDAPQCLTISQVLMGMDYVTSMYTDIKMDICVYECMYVYYVWMYVSMYSEVYWRVYVCSMCEKSTVNVYSIGEWKARLCFFELAQYMYVCMYECVPCLLNVCACRACLLMSCSQVSVGVIALDGRRSLDILYLLITSTCAQERLHGHVCMHAYMHVCMH